MDLPATMSLVQPRKENPISMRLPESDLSLIDRAARLHGHSRTEFMRDAAVRAAERILLDNQLVRMSPEGFDDFMAIIEAPPAVVPEMTRIIERPAPWEAGYKAPET